MGDMMKKKLIVRYAFLCMPFIIGVFLYSGGIINIFSSVLFFGSGYVAIKNIFDYRKVNKNIRKIFVKNDKKIGDVIENNDMDKIKKNENDLDINDLIDNYNMDISNKKIYRYNNSDNIPLLKNTRRYIRVRRRY